MVKKLFLSMFTKESFYTLKFVSQGTW